jgi:hypothetical protein
MRARTVSVFASSLLLGLGVAAGLRAPEAPAVSAAKPAAPVGTAAAAPAPAAKRPPTRAEEWKRFERLVSEQKMEAARELIDRLLAKVEGSADTAEWTRTLVEAAKLRGALGETEGAVGVLHAHPWPPDARSRTILDLYLGAAIVEYYDDASWEIDRRERVEGAGNDLKRMTREQIDAAALGAYAEAWKARASFGDAPAAALEPFVVANDYPKVVRGRLRDSLAYLYVGLLANSSMWTPEQSNELYRVDLDALLAADPKAAAAVALDDPNVHPVRKIGAVLADLAAWHAERGEREAVLEARLELARRLHEAFTLEADKAKVRADLARRLPDFRALPWWSEGAVTLAGLLQSDPAPDALVRAHALVVEGEKAYPKTRGAARCRAERERLEAPDYTLAAMTSDAPGKRSFEVSHRNVAQLWFRAFPLDLVARLDAGENAIFPEGSAAEGTFDGEKPVAQWSEALPATTDFRSHRTFLVPPLSKPGAYVVLVSARADFGEEHNRVVAAGITIGDLVLVTTQEGHGASRLRVLSAEHGDPVAGADVLVYRKNWQQGPQRVLRATSDADGLVELPASPGDGSWWGGVAVARRGGDVAWQEIGLPARVTPQDIDAALVFTDRSVYRPQQTLRFKVLVYGGKRAEGKLALRPQASVTVKLDDPNYQEVGKLSLVTNAYGSAAGEFTIPAGRPLGAWHVNVQPGGSAEVRVEEYKRPTFEVTLRAPEQALRLNRSATVQGEARYYFGLPVAAGKAHWRVTRQPIFPEWWTWWGFWGGRAPSPQVIAAGESALGEDGSFSATFLPAADERAGDDADVSYHYHMTVDVTDEGGETRDAERDYRLGAVSVAARVEDPPGFFRAATAPALTVVREDLDGSPRAGKGTWRLLRLAQPEAPRMPADEPASLLPPGTSEPAGTFHTPGDLLKARWETDADWRRGLRGFADGAEVAHGELDHDAQGRAVAQLPRLGAGAYRLRYETLDPFGAKATMQEELVVAGDGLELALPQAFAVERTTVEVGDTARFLVWSGFADQALFLERFRDGDLIERRRVEPHAGVLEEPIAADDRGGFGYRLVAVRDHQLLQSIGGVIVPWTDKSLDVSFSTFRDRLRPGAHETFRVKVTKSGGGAEVPAAEVLAYMYDRSLDLFAPHQPPSPLALFPQRASLGWSAASLGERPAEWVRQDAFDEVEDVDEWRADSVPTYSIYEFGGPGPRGSVRGGVEGGVAAGMAQPVTIPEVPKPMLKMAQAQAPSKPDTISVGFGGKKVAPEPPPPPPPGGAAPAAEVRSNFAETAFWQPNLITSADGTAAIEFTVPDSVTSWRVWAHAVTTDLRSGSVMAQTESVKDLLVRPYLPRFLREGDRATIAVVVNNASDHELTGNLAFELLDAADHHDRLADFGVTTTAARQSFTAKAGGSARLLVPVVAPRGLGEIAVRVTATAGNLSDGEQRPLPLLPSRVHLAQSRFAVLHDAERRELTFADLAKNDDPTRTNEQLVVTLDGQLFYGVLQALPYLVDYPYECTEQTLNRFLSTGIVSSLFDRYPQVARMAKELSTRDTRFETFDSADPNRKLALEETPWLELSQGKTPGHDDADPGLVRVLDPRVARAEKAAALAKLEKAQLPDGAFPWWPGGPPSDYMTIYLMYGFAKAEEFGVEVPAPMIQRGWQYLGRRYTEFWQREIDRVDCDCAWEMLTFLDYVASSYKDPSVVDAALPKADRVRMLDASYKHWKQHSPYVKGLLALTLKRMGRPQNAKLVWDSVMDSAKTTADEGTFWTPEAHSWLWYNDTIESQAFALRTLMELEPGDPREKGLVQWLFLNKKLNHWKSTRATAEVLYTLAAYLERNQQLGAREEATVHVDDQTSTFTFDPEHYTGKKAQIVVPGEKVTPAAATTVVEKTTPGLLFASATWHFSTDALPKEASGDLFAVTRKYFKRVKNGKEVVLQPLADGDALTVGDELEVHLALTAKAAAEYVHLRDPRGAGLEPESVRSGWAYDLGLSRYEEVRDSGANFFMEQLPQGEYTLQYRLRAATAGTFRVGPATVQSMYAPEFTAYSAGSVVAIHGD